MRPESENLLSTLIDGEAVDPDQLAEVLSEAGAAETLVAFVRVRHRFERDDVRPERPFYDRMAGALRPRRLAFPGRLRELAPRFAVAALVVSAALGGMWFGRHLSTAASNDVTLTGSYCTDNLGSPHRVGSVTAVDGRQLECVLRGEWVAVSR